MWGQRLTASASAGEASGQAAADEGTPADRSSAAAARMRERQEKKAAEQERIRAENVPQSTAQRACASWPCAREARAERVRHERAPAGGRDVRRRERVPRARVVQKAHDRAAVRRSFQTAQRVGRPLDDRAAIDRELPAAQRAVGVFA